MQIVYSPSAHGANASGFFFVDDKNAPSDVFPVSGEDHSEAINLPQGSTYSFTAPIEPAVTGTLVTVAPSNAYTLAQAQSIQLGLMDTAYVAANTAPIEYMATSFQADQPSQELIAAVMTASDGVLPSGFMWYDVNNNGVVMTYAQLKGLAWAILSRGQPLFTHKQTQKAAIRAVRSIAEVQSVTW